MSIKLSLFDPWAWKMAWRDSRNHRRRLLLFMSSITVGIAALVAISSLGKNLEAAIDEQAKSLLGADLLIRSRDPFTPATEALFDSLGGQQSREVGFASIVYFLKNAGTRLARIRAVEGDFPFYGEFETVPPDAAKSFRTGQSALVEEALLLQYGAEVGDSIKVGAMKFRIVGRLKKMPGESAASAFIGPRVYFPLAYLEQTQLMQRGSQITYAIYFKFEPDLDTQKLVEKIKPHLDEHRLRSETIATRKEDLSEAMQNIASFLNLVGFIALLLGSVGVASAIHVYVKQKLDAIAMLRCLGAVARQTFNIFLIQALVLGLLGSVLGAVIGIYIQTLLPKVLSDFLPVKLTTAVSWAAIAEGMWLGLGMALLFALLPLISIRNVSPLLTLRSAYETAAFAGRDPWRWLLYALMAFAISGFAMRQMQGWMQGIIFALAVGASFALLSGVARLLTAATRKFFPEAWNYVWRQGLANLFRPNNQTLMLMLAIGFGSFLIATLYLTQHTLLRQVSLTGADQQPNLVFFDIQSDQQAQVADLIRSFGLPVMQQVPIVTMRLEKVKGRDVRELQKDSTLGIPGWALRREYRSSYRDRLNENEKLVASIARNLKDPSDTIYVSLEEGIAEELRVNIGDELVFDVQGVPMITRIGSLRQVNWQRIMPSFFVLFPAGVLESAPQFQVLVTHASSTEQSAHLQRAVVQQFPNVSTIDLALILNTVDAILKKVAFVIRFMALFSILTGLLVLAGAVITSRYQRIQESVLLRTLGADRRQVLRIMTIEYFFLGGFAAFTGLLLASIASWALAKFVFETSFSPAILPMAIILIIVMGLTILIGLLNSRGIIAHDNYFAHRDGIDHTDRPAEQQGHH
jgi:putative ABC transport system permease protein